MIKVISGFTGPGGSTVAFNTLVNLFNENGLKACLYGNYKWDGITCAYKDVSEINVTPHDIVIYHFQIIPRLPAKKQILSCHETDVFAIKKLPNLVYDKVHFVSEFQKEWQGIESGIVIPNPIRKFSKRTNDGSKNVVGIIGSIDPNKRAHESITRALKDGHTDIRLYGALTNFSYFHEYVQPLLSDIVTYRGVSIDMDKTYNQLTHVYHSPLRETYNLVKPECQAAGVIYNYACGNDPKAEVWDNNRILEAWKTLLFKD